MTSKVDAAQRVKWLELWNSNPAFRISLNFQICLFSIIHLIYGYTKQPFGIRYEYLVEVCFYMNNCNYYFHIICIRYFFAYLFFLFQQLAKEALALYESTIFALNITIKIAPETVEPLSLFADYVESWRVTSWEMTFFKLFKSNDGIMKNKTFDKQDGGLQALRRVVYKYMWYLSWIYFIWYSRFFFFQFSNFFY